MTQPTDIILNGAGYMVEPATYKRLQDGHPEGATQRVSQTDFFGGQRRAIQLERDTFGNSLNVGPALGGQGVRPWAPAADTDLGFSITIDREKSIPAVIVRDRLYIAIGKTLIRGPITTPNTGFSWTIAQTFDHDITDIAIYNSQGLIIAFGAAADILYFNTVTNTQVTILPNERGTYIASYAGWAAWTDARTNTRPTILRLATGSAVDERTLDYDPIGLTTVGGKLLVITKQSLYTYTGRVKLVSAPNPAWTKGSTTEPQTINTHQWSGELDPFYQQGTYNAQDDFRFITGFGGRTLAWIAGGVHELEPNGARAGWRSTGLTGRRCFGGCVAAGYLIVAIESEESQNEIWAYDGSGWWCIARKPMPTNGIGTWCNPVSVGNGAILRNVVAFQHGTNAVTSFRLMEATAPGSGVYVSALANNAEFVSSMIDAGERDKPKAWRRIGASFAASACSGNLASTDAVAMYFDYSIDAGNTWTQAAVTTLTGNTLPNNNFQLEAALPASMAHYIMLRVRWASVSDWAPTLVGIWAEYETLQMPARRRKWNFTVHARDQEVDRNGQVLSRTGRQLIAELWAAWETDTPLPFRDIDYTAAPTERQVRIVGISEAVAQPADSDLWGDSEIALNLVEV